MPRLVSRTNHPRSVLASGIFFVWLVTGCAGNRPPADGPAPPVAEAATLVVQNLSTSEVRIYAVLTGQRVRLGTVIGLRTVNFRLPDYLVGNGRDLSFQADPIAGAQVATSVNVFVRPGDNVMMTIPPALR